jgi:hypothetical protein
MTGEYSVSVLTCLMGIGVTILLAGIPWAYGIHGRLAKIETVLKNVFISAERLGELEHRVTLLEAQRDRD